MLSESVGHRSMNIAGQLPGAHELARRFQSCWISVGHFLGYRARLALEQWTRKFHPISSRTCHLERIKQQIIRSYHSLSGNFKEGLGLSVSAGEQDVHHARTRAAREKALDRRRHDLGFSL